METTNDASREAQQRIADLLQDYNRQLTNAEVIALLRDLADQIATQDEV